MGKEPSDIPDEWEFYPCLVDDAPASILLNMWYRGNFEEIAFEQLYYGRIEMLDGDEHGMGSKDEASALFGVEDVISSELASVGLFNVGRLRNTGGWQLTFYGPDGHDDDVQRAFAAVVKEREFTTGSKHDPDWTYYHEFLYPDRERLQWIANRRQVQTLEEHGDLLDTDRPVDHYVYFPTTEAREQFIASLPVNGFPTSKRTDHSGDQSEAYGVEITRVDPVELGHIHDVVMDLAILAEKFGGDYDGWGAPIVSGTMPQEPDKTLN